MSVSLLILLQGCSGRPVKMGVTSDFKRSAYDMQHPKSVTATVSGFQLLIFIPILGWDSVNTRHFKAYKKIEAQAGNGLIGDVQIKESWTYGFIGAFYETRLVANIYPLK